MECPVNFTNLSSTTKAPASSVPDLCMYEDACGDVAGVTNTSLTALQFLLGAATFIVNIISVVILIQVSTLSSVLRLALLNLSVTDVIGSSTFMFHIVMNQADLQNVGFVCKLRYVMYVTMNVITLVTLTYLSVERLLSIAVPFVHSKLGGKKFTAVAVAVNWIISFSVIISGMHRLRSDIPLCIYHILVPRVTHLINSVLALGSIFVIIVVSVIIYIQARKQIAKIGRTIVGEAREQRIASLENKATMTTITIVIPFVILNVPLYILLLYFYFKPEFQWTCSSVRYLNGLSTLLTVNSLCNPFLYAWKLSAVRESLAKLCSCFRQSPALFSSTSKTKVSYVGSSTPAE